MKCSRSALMVIGTVALLAVVAAVTGAPTASSQAPTLAAIRAPEQPALDPNWSYWAKLPGVDVPLTAQNLTYPMGGGSVPSVNLKATHYNGVLYVRASWQDATEDVPAVDMTAFTDAVALEVPAKSAVAVPSFCMGQANSGVNIWRWRADSQAGGPDALLSTDYPNGYSDGYSGATKVLEQDPIYQPARALGNPVALSGGPPVENLIAQAFGTLSPAPAQEVDGAGSWQNGTWTVVFRRPFAAPTADQADFAEGASTNMAVAVWNGSQGDRAGQKNVSQFVTLSIAASALRPGAGHDWSALWVAVILGGGAVLTGLAMLGWAAFAGLGRKGRM